MVFEKPGSGASWNGQGVLGPAIGVITATDFLQAIVINAPMSASCADVTEDAFFPRTPQAKCRYPIKSGGSKRCSLPGEICNGFTYSYLIVMHVHDFSFSVDQAILNSLPVQVGGNHQHGLTRIFHRAKYAC